MSFSNKVATVFGGTGFLGCQVVRALARRGVIVKVATRTPASAYFLRPNGTVGQVVPYYCDYNDESSIARAVAGSDYVVNCIGILAEKRKGDFERIHAQLPASIARACTQARVRRFVHISALGVQTGTSQYSKTKRAGEDALRKIFPAATIMRPSIIFGEGDNFFNMFASLARILPFLPLIGGGKTKFQPVYVGDVASAVISALEQSRQQAKGETYELGGLETLTFKEIYQRMFAFTGTPRRLVKLPWAIAKLQASLMAILPSPLLTPDQVESLKTDSVVEMGAKGLHDLAVQPTTLDLILPRYLTRFREGGRFAEIKPV